MYKISVNYFKSIRQFQFYIIHLNRFKCFSMFFNSKTNLSIFSHKFKLKTINVSDLMMRKTITNKNFDSIKWYISFFYHDKLVI